MYGDNGRFRTILFTGIAKPKKSRNSYVEFKFIHTYKYIQSIIHNNIYEFMYFFSDFAVEKRN